MASGAEMRLKRQDAPMNVPNSIQAKNLSSQGLRTPHSASGLSQLEQNELSLLSLA